MDKVLTFTLDTAEATDSVISAVKSVAGVRDAGLINPNAKSAVGRLMAYAVVEDEADVDKTCNAVGSIRGVKDCSAPPARYAM